MTACPGAVAVTVTRSPQATRLFLPRVKQLTCSPSAISTTYCRPCTAMTRPLRRGRGAANGPGRDVECRIVVDLPHRGAERKAQRVGMTHACAADRFHTASAPNAASMPDQRELTLLVKS